jgi:hypothetical protein
MNTQSRQESDGIVRGELQSTSSCDAAFSISFSSCALPFCDAFSFYHLAWYLLSVVGLVSWASLEKSAAQAFLLLSSPEWNLHRSPLLS